MLSMTPFEKLRNMKRVGARGQAGVKGDYFRTGPKRQYDVIDEEAAIVGDSRYALELRKFEDGGGKVIWFGYWTIEGRARPGANEQRVGYGQYSPMLPPRVFFELVERARAKGWFNSDEDEEDEE